MIEFLSNIYISYGDYILLAVLLLGLVLILKMPLFTMQIAVFTLPLKSLYIWVGTNIEIWKILSGAFLILYTPSLALRNYKYIKSNRNYKLFMLFCIYAIAITCVFFFALPDSIKHIVSGGYFKNEGRVLYQLVFFALTMNLVLIPTCVLKRREDIDIILKTYLYSVIFLSILGIMQWGSVEIVGFDPFPIKRFLGTYESAYVVATGYESAFRMNSLAGEPKHMAIALIIGIVILMLCNINNYHIIKHELPVLTLFVLCLLGTFSTTGFVWFGISMIFILALYSFRMPRKLLVIFIVTAVTMGVIYFVSGEQHAPLIVKTLEKTGLEVQDQAVYDYFKDNPADSLIGFGLGNIHYFAVKYLPVNFPLFKNSPFKGNTGLFFFLGDVGLLGIVIFTFFVLGLVKSTINFPASLQLKCKKRILVHLVIIGSILFIFRYNEIYFVIIGLLLFLNNELRFERILKLNSVIK